jgi:sugar O-acyltransferase (sialic acid O-acetyltransferase NeuD family)
MSRPRVIVWGAGGHGKVVVDALLTRDDCDIIGIIDDDRSKKDTKVLGIPVLFTGIAEVTDLHECDGVIVAIGDNYVRYAKIVEVRKRGFKTPSVVHPAARLSKFCQVSDGVVVLAGAIINAGTEIRLGACVNTSASVDHDNRIGGFCHIFPNATLTGGIHVGEFAYVGSGATITPNCRVGDYSYVGAGATVIKNVAEGTIVAGVPAAVIGRQTKRPQGAEKRSAHVEA